MDFNWREPRRIVTASRPAKQRPPKRSVLAFLQILLQSILPSWHADSVLFQALRRKDGIRRTRRRTRHLLSTDRTNLGGETRTPNNLASEFKPRAIPRIGHMHNPARIFSAQLDD